VPEAPATPPLHDCFVRHGWASDAELLAHLPAGWREYMVLHSPRAWHDHLVGAGPEPPTPLTGPIATQPGYPPVPQVTSLAQLCDGYLGPAGVTRALLVHGTGLHVGGVPTVRLAVALTRALNDWTLERWCGEDLRVHALVAVCSQVPDEAATEIRRVGGAAGMAGVLLGADGVSKPFGHPLYDPIHRAAAELGLPLVVVAGGDVPLDAGAYPTGAGFPQTAVEMRTLAHQSLATHAASFLGQGVFARYPDLKVLLLGGGLGWVGPWLWRMDTNYRAFRHDVLWLGDDPPSEHAARHLRVGTHPFDHPADAGDAVTEYFALEPAVARMACFASGHPGAGPSAAAALGVLPGDWAPRVLHGNAEELFGWA
jgi:predicted TIM-barrel fold metal-dependent hydrolase